MDAVIVAKQKLVAAGRKRYLLDVDRKRLRKEVGVENVKEARELLRSLKNELADLEGRQEKIIRRIERKLKGETPQ